MKIPWFRSLLALTALLALAACNGDGGEPEAAADSPAVEQSVELPNACPQEGCRVEITEVEQAERELELTFDANFDPDLSQNHFHVYWDNFTAEQVSDDAEPRFGVTQGDWEPIDENPYTTSGAASVTERGEATGICVTASDRDHNVLDPEQFDCADVSDFVE